MGWLSKDRTKERQSVQAMQQQQLSLAAAAPAAATPATSDMATTLATPVAAPAPTPAPVRVATDVVEGSQSTGQRGRTATQRSFGLGSTLLVPGGGAYPVVFGDRKTLLGQ